ncbi:RHS repeat domain-containing protein [Flectobacillus major]|uniref:RHS repeat domain-containing protein n=1 Tax=Flectobacillus major TaxID=103 RepID=UPI0005C65DEA|nr:RHS repeat-associated core domain-containing protein [Flectobacillus major]
MSFLKSAWKADNFKFTGKEFESQTGFNDFGWRRQDPILGRMWSPDPMAEKYFDLSTYNFVANNPVKLIDPDGREIWINYGDGQKVRYENGKLYNEDGSKYNGKDVFVNAVIRNLNKINSTENGKSILNTNTMPQVEN